MVMVVAAAEAPAAAEPVAAVEPVAEEVTGYENI
jgi:hypothetical protein